MKKLLMILPLLLLLTACGTDNMARARSLRERMQTGDGCSFSMAITADYDTEQYDFSMDCTWKPGQGISFTVTKPETVAGITGTVTETGGALTFDDKILAFAEMADGLISPVQCPYEMMHTLQKGYFRTCTVGSGTYCLEADSSYGEDCVRMELWMDKDSIPQNGSFSKDGNRVLSFTVESFRFL